MRTYSVTVSLVGIKIAVKIATAENAYDACVLMEKYMHHPSQYDANIIEKIRTQYKLADVWFDYEAHHIEQGVYEDMTVNEYAVVKDGEIVSWARDWGVAENRYKDELRVRREHARNNEPIPFDGSATEYDTDDNVSVSELGIQEVM